MAVTLAQARTQINDVPRVYPPASSTPEVIGTGDGVTTVFYLAHANIVPSSLSVFLGTTSTPPEGPPSITWSGVASTSYTQGGTSTPETTGPTQALITFTTAPASGTIVGVRYMATALSDADLNAYVARNQTRYTDDQTTLKGISYDFLDVLLTNVEALKLHRYGEYMHNAMQLVMALTKQKESLRLDLTGSPRAGKAIPALASANRVYRHYQPRR